MKCQGNSEHKGKVLAKVIWKFSRFQGRLVYLFITEYSKKYQIPDLPMRTLRICQS